MQKSIILQISKAIEYFNADLPQISNFNQKQFEKHLQSFKLVLQDDKYSKIRSKISQLLIAKYFSFVKNKYSISDIEEYLIQKLIELAFLAFQKIDFSMYQQKNNQKINDRKNTTNQIVVFYSALMSHLTDLTQLSNKISLKYNFASENTFIIQKNELSLNSFKKFVSLQQKLFSIIYKSLLIIVKLKVIPIQSIYPKTFSILSQSLNRLYEANYKNFQMVLSSLLIIMKQNQNKMKKQPFSMQKLNNCLLIQQKANQPKLKQKSYQQQCTTRLIQMFKKVYSKSFNLTLPYKQKLIFFLKGVKDIEELFAYQQFAIQYFKISQLLQMNVKLTFVDNFTQNLLKQWFTKRWIQLINILHNKISTEKTISLKQIKFLQKYIKITDIQSFDLIINKIKQMLFSYAKKVFVQVNQNVSYSQSIPLTQLNHDHSFSNYPVQLSALSDSFIFQSNKISLNVFDFFQHSHQNLKLFEEIFIQIPFEVKHIFLQILINDLLVNSYSLQMNLISFYDLIKVLFLTSCLLSQTQQFFNSFVGIGLIKNLWGWITNNNQIKKLQVRGKQQELLIYWIIRVSLKAYLILVNHQKRAMKKLEYKVKIIQLLFEFLQHKTYLLQLTGIHAILYLASPYSISQFLVPIYSTILHRNYKNLNIVKYVSRLSNMNQKQSEQLVQMYLKVPQKQIQEVILQLIPNLKTQTIRKCILTANKWYLLMNQKTIKLLNNQSMRQQAKGQKFHMNDGDNVTIDNALGVVILQIKQKFIWQLNSPKKQFILDIIINFLSVNRQMVFFKTFFSNILKCFVEILKFIDSQQSNKNQRKSTLYQRIRSKIFRILIQIPKENYNMFQKQIKNSLCSIIGQENQGWKKQSFMEGKSESFQIYKLSKKIMQTLDLSKQN